VAAAPRPYEHPAPAGDPAPTAKPGPRSDSSAGPSSTPATVIFGITTLGQWAVELRDEHGATLPDVPTEPTLDPATFATHDPAAAVALQAALRARYPTAEVVWRPGVMDTLNEHTAAAHRALAEVRVARDQARAATEAADALLRAAIPFARTARIGTAEIGERTGYARSTITDIVRKHAAAAAPEQPAPPAPATDRQASRWRPTQRTAR
jgi:hypothetical protein